MKSMKAESVRVGRGDLLRLLQSGGMAGLHKHAHLAGFAPRLEERKKSPLELSLLRVKPERIPGDTAVSPQKEYQPPAVYPRIVDCRPSTALPEPEGESGDYELPAWYLDVATPDPDAIQAEDVAPPEKEELITWPRLWPRLRSLLSETSRSHQPDIPALVGRMARVELVEKIPKRSCSRWTSSLIILVERADQQDRRLQIFNRDINLLIERLELMRGGLGLKIQTIIDRPGGMVKDHRGEEYTEQEWRLPPPGATILIVSDLGLYSPRAIRKKQWLSFGEALNRQGFNPIALLPVPAQWLPLELATTFQCISWDRGSGLRQEKGQRKSVLEGHEAAPKEQLGKQDKRLVQELLAWLSPAVRVEPFLLRAARHLLAERGASVGHEAMVWNHEDVEQDQLGFSFREETAQHHQQRLAELATQYPRLAKKMCRLLIDSHRYLFPTRRAEELLILAELMGDHLTEQDREKLEKARNHMVGLFRLVREGGRYGGALRGYFAHLLERQHKKIMGNMPCYQGIWACMENSRREPDLVVPPDWDWNSVRPFLEKKEADELAGQRNYLLLAYTKDQLRIVEETVYLEESKLFQKGGPLLSFTSRTGFYGISETRGVRIIPLENSLPIQLPERGSLGLHCGGEERTLQSASRPGWASTISMGPQGMTATSSDTRGEYRWYWNPPVVAPPGMVSTFGDSPSSEPLTCRGLWYPELLEDPFRPPVPNWATDCLRDQFGIAAQVEIQGVKQWLRWIEPTRFMMGSPEDEKGRFEHEILHPVVLTRGYWLAESACSQELWQAVMGDNPSHFKGKMLPVEQVSWDDVMDFLVRANSQQPDLKLCLPTEAEWENACRAGTTTPFSFGTEPDLGLLNYSGKWEFDKKDMFAEEALQKTTAVRDGLVNDWGLFQMHGNVFEWCADRFGEYPQGEVVNSEGPKDGGRGGDRVLRGGSWYVHGRYCRSACRNRFGPSYRYWFIGFRLARGHEPGSSLQGKGRLQEGWETTGERAETGWLAARNRNRSLGEKLRYQ